MSTTTETTETGTVTTETTPKAGLGVNDLKLMARVIQVSAERGAFKADELQAVGGLYNRTIEFLRATGNLDPAPAPETSEGEEAPADEAGDEEAPAEEAGEDEDTESEE